MNKVYAEVNMGDKRIINGEIYIVVQGLDGTNLADSINQKLVGKNMIDAQDVDGRHFSGDMAALAKNSPRSDTTSSLYSDDQEIRIKDMYREVVNSVRACSGVNRH